MKRALLSIGVVILLTFSILVNVNGDHYLYPDPEKTEEMFYAKAPTIFQDMDGRYWMGFIHIQNEELNIGVCWSDDLLSWSQPVVVDANVYLHADTIVFFQSQDGMYNLIYRECFITNPEASVDHMLRRSSDGIHWDDETHITKSAYTVSAIQLRDGRYCLASDFLSTLSFRWTDDPTSWSYLRHIKRYEELHEGWVRNPYIYEDNDGRICVTFTKGYSDDVTPMQVYSTYSEDGGVTWIEPIRVSNGWGERHSSITQDKNGKYWIVWASPQGVRNVDYFKELFYSTSWDLENWSSPERLIDEKLELSLLRPEIKQFEDGRLIVVADYGILPYHSAKYIHNQIFVMEIMGDIDGDGFEMGDDKFPSDPSASVDTDRDGYPDDWNEGMNETDSNSGLKLDKYPEDPDEWEDDDNDGYGDNKKDRFPHDPSEWNDTDSDGHGDNSDEFPDNSNEWEDRDKDGYGDNERDEFPRDPNEWDDTDGDNIGDNTDRFPNNGLEWMDSDLDGFGDNCDAFPYDMAASVDHDNDGYPDRWNYNRTEKDSTTMLKLDHFPEDPDKWKEPEYDYFWVWVVNILLVVVILTEIFGYIIYKKVKSKVRADQRSKRKME